MKELSGIKYSGGGRDTLSYCEFVDRCCVCNGNLMKFRPF